MITVVVCCHNSSSRLKDFFFHFERSVPKDEIIELVVVNNASTDDTRTVAENLAAKAECIAQFKAIDEPKAGLMFARRAGVNAAVGDIVCFLDDDNLVTPSYFKAVRQAFASQHVGFFGCSTMLPSGRTFPPELQPFSRSYAVGDAHSATGELRPDECVWGAGLAVRAQVLKKIFGSQFEPLLIGRSGSVQMAGDDSEICHAVALMGWSGWYAREPLIFHAISEARMNAAKLQLMWQGFGASDIILTRYRRKLRGENVNVGYIAAAKFAKYCLKFLVAWVKNQVKADIRYAVLLAHSRGAINGLPLAFRMAKKQDINFRVLDSLGRLNGGQ